jgi:hypothetical protein
VPETPVLDDEGEKKETIKYSIFSFLLLLLLRLQKEKLKV